MAIWKRSIHFVTRFLVVVLLCQYIAGQVIDGTSCFEEFSHSRRLSTLRKCISSQIWILFSTWCISSRWLFHLSSISLFSLPICVLSQSPKGIFWLSETICDKNPNILYFEMCSVTSWSPASCNRKLRGISLNLTDNYFCMQCLLPSAILRKSNLWLNLKTALFKTHCIDQGISAVTPPVIRLGLIASKLVKIVFQISYLINLLRNWLVCNLNCSIMTLVLLLPATRGGSLRNSSFVIDGPWRRSFLQETLSWKTKSAHWIGLNLLLNFHLNTSAAQLLFCWKDVGTPRQSGQEKFFISHTLNRHWKVQDWNFFPAESLDSTITDTRKAETPRMLGIKLYEIA